jgi:hypothetical protein
MECRRRRPSLGRLPGARIGRQSAPGSDRFRPIGNRAKPARGALSVCRVPFPPARWPAGGFGPGRWCRDRRILGDVAADDGRSQPVHPRAVKRDGLGAIPGRIRCGGRASQVAVRASGWLARVHARHVCGWPIPVRALAGKCSASDCRSCRAADCTGRSRTGADVGGGRRRCVQC